MFKTNTLYVIGNKSFDVKKEKCFVFGELNLNTEDFNFNENMLYINNKSLLKYTRPSKIFSDYSIFYCIEKSAYIRLSNCWVVPYGKK